LLRASRHHSSSSLLTQPTPLAGIVADTVSVQPYHSPPTQPAPLTGIAAETNALLVNQILITQPYPSRGLQPVIARLNILNFRRTPTPHGD